MTALNSLKTLAAVVGLAATTAGCGDVVRQGRSPVFLVVDGMQAARGTQSTVRYQGTLLSDVITLVTSPAPCTTQDPCRTIFNDLGRADLSIQAKNIDMAPTSNNAVTINRYRVDYIRADGRNRQGVDVPYGFDGAVTATVYPGSRTTVDFEIVRHVAKEETPLVQLGYNPGIISTIANVTFYGRDVVGNEVVVTGSILVDFGNFGD